MAALEYEVRDEYRDYTVAQLLESPVTCFQGVGDIQSDLLQRYFNVATVKDLAQMGPFVDALGVQETVLEGGDVLGQTVAEAGRQRQLNFHIREADQTKHIGELPEAPVHVLDGLTPGQDLALYDAFRITNVTHLAQNRIMLEARVIDYLAEHGGAGEGPVGSEAVATILGARAASAAAGQARARSEAFDEASRMQNLATEVTEHVRDRVAAMRDRARDQAGTVPGTRAEAGAAPIGSGLGRMEAIRQSRGAGGVGGRQADVTRGRGAGVSRTEEILATRGPGAGARESARSVADRRRDEVTGHPGATPEAGGSRAASVLAARQLAGRGGPPQGATGGATVRARPGAGTGGGTSTATATRAGEAPGAAGAAAAAGAPRAVGAGAGEGGGPTLRTEEEAAAAGAAGAGAGAGGAATRRTVRRQPNPAPIIAAAILALIILGALIWFLVSRSGPQETTTAGSAGTTQVPSEYGTQQQGQPGQPGAAGQMGTAGQAGQPGAAGQAGTQPGAAGAPGTAATAQGPGTAPAPVAIKGTHTVRRGDTLWFISQKEYADPLNWPSIFMENKDQIRNPDLIYPKQKFRIPATPTYRYPEYPKAYRGNR